MTRTNYERAVEINNRLDYLEDMIALFINATDHLHTLAAVRVADSYVSVPNIANEMKLDADLRDQFLKILRDEQKQLRDEFDNL